MRPFWKIVNEVIAKSDILLIVLDARFVESTRNIEIENRITREGKSIIHVITKCDLVEKETLEHYKQSLHPCVFISSTKFYGLNVLKERIFQDGRKDRPKESEVVVGVLGYPNTGKSSLINAMTNRSAASTSKLSGWTKSMKLIRASKGLVFLDTPGVIPISEENSKRQTMIGSIDFTKTKDADVVINCLITENPGTVEQHYAVSPSEDPEETVEKIAIKHKMIKKGGKPDVERAYVLILKDWQAGKIKRKEREFVE